MLQIYRRVGGAALFALASAPVAALAEDASAIPAQGLVSFLAAPATATANPGTSVASLPPDAMVPPPPLPTDRGFYISADGGPPIAWARSHKLAYAVRELAVHLDALAAEVALPV